MPTDLFEKRVEGFRALLESVIREHYARNGFTFEVPHVEIASRGKRYYKLAKYGTREGVRDGQTMVEAFVDIDTGSIYKPASWRAPAKHPRGNIWDADGGRSALTPQGSVRYMR